MIFDTIRKKFVSLTPEEWVRQHVIHYLINEKKYPASLIVVEGGHKLNSTRKRCDVLVYDTFKRVALLVECKAPGIEIDKGVLEQAMRYNLTINATLILLSNGFQLFCVGAKEENGKLMIVELPDYQNFNN